MPPRKPPPSDKKRAKLRQKKENKKEKKRKAEEETAAALGAKKRKRDSPKNFRKDWAEMKKSLRFDEMGVGRTPAGDFAYFPKDEALAGEKVSSAGQASERAKWMSLDFVEEGEGAREMMPETDEESQGEEEEEEDVDVDVEMRGVGGGDALVGVEEGVAGLVLSGLRAR